MSADIIQADALALPLADDSVDLVVTSPPYFGLRSYQDGGEHYEGQIGDEATPAEFVDALIAATREMMRVVKPTGSIFVNLGDKYNAIRPKSLIGVPWRYAIRCIDELGLILRAEIIWSKPNGLPESVTDRVRRSHETWFHFTLQPRYFSGVDEIREAHVYPDDQRHLRPSTYKNGVSGRNQAGMTSTCNPLGKLPGSVWTIPTQPLIVPDELGVDHFAAFPTEWPRRIIKGWSPVGICVECGEGRRPVKVTEHEAGWVRQTVGSGGQRNPGEAVGQVVNNRALHTITGYACGCDQPTADTRPAVVLDPFGGTGTTALVAHALGRHGISVDLSSDYCRLARWRTSDPGEIARAKQQPKPKPVIVHKEQEVLW